jgi:hypothetical protein
MNNPGADIVSTLGSIGQFAAVPTSISPLVEPNASTE